MGQMKNQLRVRKGNQPQSQQGPSQPMGGREFGQVIEPMQAEMASGNEGLAENPSSGGKKSHGKRKRAA